MAKREPQPREHVIEPSRDGSTCVTCGKPIADGELRFTEAFVSDDGKWARGHRSARTPRTRDFEFDDDRSRSYDGVNPDLATRFHHLACAAQHEPYKLRSALASSPLDEAARAELAQQIERALAAVDPAEDNADTRDEYHRLLAHVRESRDDDAVLVFGDWLQSVGDPRGQLVAVQHKLESATGEDRVRLQEIERKLLAVHRKQFLPERLDHEIVWRRGFVHRITIKGAVDPVSLGRAFAHPSFRLLRELVLRVDAHWPLVIAAGVPASVRTIDLGSGQLGAIGKELAAVPDLVRLRVCGVAAFDAFAHPALAELELETSLPPRSFDTTSEAPRIAEHVAHLDRKRLPGLVHVILHVAHDLDAVVTALAHSKLYAQLRTLTLNGPLSAAIANLTRSKHRFDTLDVRGSPGLSPDELDRLAKVATTVLRYEAPTKAPPAPKKVGEWLVRHPKKPEWGTGRVLGETEDGGLDVEFEHGGKKHIKDPELLDEIES